MLCRSLRFLASSAAAAAASASSGGSSFASGAETDSGSKNVKMTTLHKLLIGEAQLRNKTPLKVCYIAHNFGPNWYDELMSYAKSLSAEERNVIERQVARVQFTRYTTRELAAYCGEGVSHLDSVAREANVAQGKAYLQQNGEQAFDEYVQKEAVNAKWSEEAIKQFIRDVKAGAK